MHQSSEERLRRGLDELLEAPTVLDAAEVVVRVPLLATPDLFEGFLDYAYRNNKLEMLQHLARLYRIISLARVFGANTFNFFHFLVPHDEIDVVSEHCASLSAPDQRNLSERMKRPDAADFEPWAHKASTLVQAWKAVGGDHQLAGELGSLCHAGYTIWRTPTGDESVSFLVKRWISALFRDPVMQLPAYSRNRAVRIAAIAVGHLAREQKFTDLSDLEISHASALLREAISDTGLDSTVLSNLIVDCAAVHRFCIHSGRGIREYHLDCGIALLEEAASRETKDDFFPTVLDWLTEFLGYRFNERHDVSDLDKAIKALQRLLALAPEDYRGDSWRLRLASSLGAQFSHTQQIQDLDDALALLSIIDTGENARPEIAFSTLRTQLALYRQCAALRQSVADLDAAVVISDLLARRVVHDHAEWCVIMDAKAHLLNGRYQVTRDPDDLQSAIQSYECVRLDALVDPSLRLRIATNWAVLLRLRFNDFGAVDDLMTAIAKLDETLGDKMAATGPRVAASTELGIVLLQHFEATGKQEALDRSIRLLEQASAHLKNASTAGCLQSLAHAYSSRFSHRGDLKDLERSMTAIERAVAMTDPQNPNYAQFLESLSGKLTLLFDAQGSLSDLTRALETMRESVAHTDPSDRQAPGRWYNLGILLNRMYRRNNDPLLLDEAIDSLTRAVDRGSETWPTYSTWLSGLANSLGGRYELNGDVSDLNRSINYLERALQLASETSEQYPLWLANLAMAHLQRFEFEHSERNEALEKAIELAERSLQLISEASAERPMMLNNLGATLYARYALYRRASDRQRALELLREANDTSLSIGAALYSLRNWMGLAFRSSEWKDVTEGFQSLEALRTRLLAANPSREMKMSWLRDLQGLGTMAAAAFVELGDLENAIVALEQTQATILHEVLDLVPGDLRRLANQGRGELALEFSSAGDRWRKLNGMDFSALTERNRGAAMQELKESRAALDSVVAHIRLLPDFSHFLKSIGWRDVEDAAARHGVLAYAVAASNRGFFLIVDDMNGTGVSARMISLPSLTAREFAANAVPRELSARAFSPDTDSGTVVEWERAFDNFARWFWEAAVSPLVADVRMRNESVTIIPIGRLIGAPWVAAWEDAPELHSGRRYVIDEINLRLAPTARILARASRAIDRASLKLLAVVDPVYNGMAPLTFSSAEQSAVTAGVHATTTLSQEIASRDLVLDQVHFATAAHFCCHGSTNLVEPLDGYLLLSAGQRLTLRDLLAVRLDSMELVTLSACETGAHGDVVPDETMGLASGILAVGARAVIAALWPIPDLATAMLIYRLHAEWRGGAPNSAEALRRAQKWLRDSTNGEKYQYFFDEATAEDGHSPAAAAQFVGPLAFLSPGLRGQEHPRHWASFTFYGTP